MKRRIFEKLAIITAMMLVCCIVGSTVYAVTGALTAARTSLSFDFDKSLWRNTSDAVLLLRKIDGLQDESAAGVDADVSGDGKVTVYDAICMLKLLLNEYDEDEALKIVTYNIKCGWYDNGNTLETIAQMLIDVDADIVGLQEVDCNTTRSSLSGDQLAKLAELTGYQYYQYTPVIYLTSDELNKTAVTDPAERNSVYGHGILSKYPIKNHTVIRPTEQMDELRAIARHEIEVGDKTIAFYNCHLNTTVGNKQYEELQDNYMIKDEYAVFVGDTNSTLTELDGYVDTENFELLTDTVSIDHVIVSKDTISYKDYGTQTSQTVKSYTVPEFTWNSKTYNTASDHSLQYVELDLKD